MKPRNEVTNVTDVLERYLLVLQQIDASKQELVAIAEEACELPGVEKKPFKALALAIHEAPGTTTAKLESLEDFIEMTFRDEDQAQMSLKTLRPVS